jgi:hypothetical protein
MQKIAPQIAGHISKKSFKTTYIISIAFKKAVV